MDSEQKLSVAVLGAGTMGHGIAQVSAVAGHEVVLRDIEEYILDDAFSNIEDNLQGAVERDLISREEMEGALSRLSRTTSLERAVSEVDLVVEAVPEDVELKKEVLEEADKNAPDDVIMATNTSSLPVTEIANAVDDPSKFIGLHFFNPVHIMDLVEIVVAEQTSEDTEEFAETFVDGLEKTSVRVEDSAGFATSRLGAALGVEAMRMVDEGVASPEDIDTAMRLGYNHPMGPIELGDHVGLDVRLDILEHLREELGERFRPPQILRKKVRAGKLGKKTGEGFYVWEDGEKVGASANDNSESNQEDGLDDGEEGV